MSADLEGALERHFYEMNVLSLYFYSFCLRLPLVDVDA